MKSFWSRIAFRAVIVFAIGMVVVQVIKFSKSKVRHVVNGKEPITIPLGFIPFKVGGERFGTVRSLKLLRDDQQHLQEVQLGVRLGDRADADRLPACDLYLGNTTQISDSTSFTCLTDALKTSGAAMQMGRVILTPTNREIAFWADSAAVREMRSTKLGRKAGGDATIETLVPMTPAQAAGSGTGDGASEAARTVQVVRGKNGEVVRMISDSNGFNLSVVGLDGDRVQVRAGPSGVMVERAGSEETARLASAYADAKRSAAMARAEGDQRVAMRAEDRSFDILREMRHFTPEQYARVIDVTTRTAGAEAALPVLKQQQEGTAKSGPPAPPKPPTP